MTWNVRNVTLEGMTEPDLTALPAAEVEDASGADPGVLVGDPVEDDLDLEEPA